MPGSPCGMKQRLSVKAYRLRYYSKRLCRGDSQRGHRETARLTNALVRCHAGVLLFHFGCASVPRVSQLVQEGPLP